MITSTIILFLLGPGFLPMEQPGDPSKAMEAIVARLKERHDRLTGIVVDYRRETIPTKRFVDDYAGDMKMKPEDVLKQFTSSARAHCVQLSNGLYLIDCTDYDSSGAELNHWLLSNDGKNSWRQAHIPREQQLQAAETTINDPMTNKAIYLGAFNIELLLADSLSPFSKPLYARLSEGNQREPLDDANVDGVTCKVFRWTEPLEGTISKRFTTFLDPGHELVMRKLIEEFRTDDEAPWKTNMVWSVQDIGVINVDRSHRYYYPKSINMHDVAYNGDEGHKTIEYKFEVENFRLNPVVAAASFTPRIEDGSNVMDGRTKQISIYGQRASRRLRELTAKRVEEGKEKAKNAMKDGLPGAGVPPTSGWDRYGLWIALFIGGACLVIATILKWRKG